MTVVGVDLGGTKISAAVVDATGEAGRLARVPTPAAAGPAEVLDAVADLVREVLALHSADSPLEPHIQGMGLRGVGVGAAGIIDVRRGVVLSATDSLPGWAGTDVVAGLRSRLTDLDSGSSLPPRVVVQNDVDAHAVGEAWVGAATSRSSALVVAIGTGIGGSWLVDGRPWRGSRSVAGAIGHVPAPGAEHLRCACGRYGHVEAIGAGPGLHRHYLSIGGDPAPRDARAVVAAAAVGDAVAGRALAESATAVGRTVAGLVTTLDPEVVVMTGGVTAAGPLWWLPFQSALRGELVDVLADVPILRARLGERAAVVGAARPVWEVLL